MPWWGWITVGALLLVAELTVVDLDFYLVFLGISALLVGGAELAGFAMPFWLQWVVFGSLSLASLVFFRRIVYGWLRPPAEDSVQEGVAGDQAVAIDLIEAGGRGNVTLRGANWTGHNIGDEAIPAGATCRVERAEGVVLRLRLESGGV